MTARTLLPLAEQAVSIASEIIRTKAPGIVTAKGDRDMATEVDYAVEHAVRDFLSRETLRSRSWARRRAAAARVMV